MKLRKRVVLFGVIALFASLSMTACNKQSPAPQAEPVVVSEPDIEHSVQYPGETLAVIAKWYTGKATNWTAIRDANPGLRPERINLGQVIMIPRSLVVEERPMPREFVKSVSSAKTVSKESEVAPVDAPTSVTPTVDSGVSSSAAEVAVTEPVPTAAPEVIKNDTVIDPAPSSSSAAAATDDKEREKLLDELLQQ